MNVYSDHYQWLESRRNGKDAGLPAPAKLQDERKPPSALSSLATREYFLKSRGTVAGGYSVSILEVDSASSLCKWIERYEAHDEFTVIVLQTNWVILIWR
jgi:hypothetical protein